MASGQAKTAEELTAAIRSLVDRALESETRDQIATRAREVAAVVADAAAQAGEAAGEAWRESEPQRREAAKQARRASREALKWGRRRWQRQVLPMAKQTWDKRVVTALGGAGIAVPASREIVDEARVRLGLKRREQRHWRAFFIGILIGAAAGAIAALLTAPRPGRQMRDELATRAREAASNASEWVPIFQREATEIASGTDTPGTGSAIPMGDAAAPARSRRVVKDNGADVEGTPPIVEATDQPANDEAI